MSTEKRTGSEFVDFIEGYIRAFPSEEVAIRKIFKEVTGLDYTNKIPVELWLLVKNHSHRLIVPDPYKAITLPIYTFDLNAAEVEDLLTIKGLQKEEVSKIVEYRKTNGFFTSFDQLNEIKNISSESINLIKNSEFDENYVENIATPELSFKSLLIAPIKHLIFRTLMYFTIIFGLIYLLFLRKMESSIKRILIISITYLFQWVLFILSGLIFVVLTDQPWKLLILLSILFMLITALIHRRTRARRNRALFSTCLMGLLVLLSLI